MNEVFKKVEEQEKAAKAFGFYWENIDQLLEQIHSECVEVKEAYEKKHKEHLEEEIGDMLQAAMSLAIFCEIDAEKALFKSIDKFQQRYQTLVNLTKKDGLKHLHQQPVEVLMNYWTEAKKQQK